MLEYDRQSPIKSWIQLVLCYLVVFSGTAAAVYLLWKIHWVAGIIIATPVWILLVCVFINGRKSLMWYILDFLRHILIFAGTAVVAWYLWKIDWRIGAISILPVFILLLNIIGFLTLPIYDITPEVRTGRKMFKKLEKKLESK